MARLPEAAQQGTAMIPHERTLTADLGAADRFPEEYFRNFKMFCPSV